MTDTPDTRASDARRTVVLITGSLRGGGAERVLSGMANYWSRAGWKVVMVTWSGAHTPDVYELDTAVQRVWLGNRAAHEKKANWLRLNASRVRRLRLVLKKYKPQAVLSFITTSNVLTILAATGLPCRVVVSERIDPAADTTATAVWRSLRKVVYQRADAIVAQSARAANWVAHHCKKEAQVIPNPLRPLPEYQVERELLIVAVGRLAKQKGFDVLLSAFATLANDFPQWQLALVGDGVERDSLRRQTKELGLTDQVHFVGYVQDVEQWMARAGVVAQPSRFEGFPNVLLESMGMGAAVISSDCPSGPADIIRHGMNGLLVPVEDVEALSNALSLLMRDPRQRARLGRAALRVKDRFREDVIMTQWEQCLFG